MHTWPHTQTKKIYDNSLSDVCCQILCIAYCGWQGSQHPLWCLGGPILDCVVKWDGWTNEDELGDDENHHTFFLWSGLGGGGVGGS